MPIRLFYYVQPATGGISHRMYAKTKVEGNLTACGRIVDVGWTWARRLSKHRRRCIQCERAA